MRDFGSAAAPLHRRLRLAILCLVALAAAVAAAAAAAAEEDGDKGQDEGDVIVDDGERISFELMPEHLRETIGR